MFGADFSVQSERPSGKRVNTEKLGHLAHANLSKFSEKQWTPNHPQYLSGLSCALFQTTFLKIAVYIDTLIRNYIIFYSSIYVYTFILYFYIIGKWFCHQYFCLVVDVVGDFSWGHKIQCIEYTIDWKKSKVCCRERYNRTILYRLEVNSNYKLINLFNPTYYL